MTTITETIKANVPIEYADKEWTEYLFTSMYKANANTDADLSRESEKIDADACVVKFAETDEAVTVSVSVECQVSTESERVREQLRRDLEQYREFLLKRCSQDGCRSSS